MTKNIDQQNIFILLESQEDELEMVSFFVSLFPGANIFLFFWDDIKEKFISKDKPIKNIEVELFMADVVVNLLPKSSNIYRTIGQKLEKMKLMKWQNSIATSLLFFQKSNVKNIFSKFKVRTPIFKKIYEETASELFSNFTQPSRIFSKSNDFYSGKLETLDDIEEVLKDIAFSSASYYIEEYIEGADWFVFVYKTKDGLEAYSSTVKATITKKDEDLIEEVKELGEEYFLNFGIEKFALFHFKESLKQKIYFLSIFTSLNIFKNSHKEVLDSILADNNLDLAEMLSSIED